jgi:exosome complex component RRP4
MTEIKKIVIPGELIVAGNEYLPGEGTEKRKEGIVSLKFGLAEEANKLIKVIALSGTYQPRRGNVVIGRVENVTFNGWVINIDTAQNAFLPLMETPRYVDKDAMEEVMDIGDIVVAKIWNVSKRGIDLTIKMHGFGKLESGLIMTINSNKVPRVIGKEGSMIALIKEETGCRITVGQNGIISIEGDNVEDEILAKRAIMFVSEKSFMSGLTEELKKWLEAQKKEKHKK